MDRKQLEALCRKIAAKIIERLPKGVGMALVLYDFGDKGSLAYMSNGNERRAEFVLWLMGRDSGYLAWVEVEYGGDGGPASIVADCKEDAVEQ